MLSMQRKFIFLSKLLCIFTSFFLVFSPSLTNAESKFIQSNVSNFVEAKKHLRQIYKENPYDFYCGCKFFETQYKGKQTLLLDSNCGIKPRKNPERAKRIEWEHVVSAHMFGNFLPCWREEICSEKGKKFKGRKCCQKVDPRFYQMEADMHNIFPVPGELNGDRQNFHYGLLPQTPYNYGNCSFKVDFKQRLAEPAPNIRGDIARAYFYMESKYGIRISKKNRRLYEIWNESDPPDDWEKRRNQMIAKIQGNDNPYITNYGQIKE